MSEIGSFIDRSLSVLRTNQYVSGGVALALIVYAVAMAPYLSEPVANMFDSIFVKALLLLLIVFVAQYNITVAIIAAVAFFVTLQTVSKYQMGQQLIGIVNVDGGSPESAKPVNHQYNPNDWRDNTYFQYVDNNDGAYEARYKDKGVKGVDESTDYVDLQ